MLKIVVLEARGENDVSVVMVCRCEQGNYLGMLPTVTRYSPGQSAAENTIFGYAIDHLETTVPGLSSDPFAAFGLLLPAIRVEDINATNAITAICLTVDPKSPQKYKLSHLGFASRDIQACEELRIFTPRAAHWQSAALPRDLTRWHELTLPQTTGLPFRVSGLQSLLSDSGPHDGYNTILTK